MNSCEFPATPVAVAAARRFTLEGLVDEDQELRERVELMVSELAANAVVHAATSFEVTVLRTSDHVRVEVRDTDASRPAVRWPDTDQPRGRGLQIVNALADRWGIEAWVDGKVGKTVWFTVDLVGPSGPAGGGS